MSETGAFCLRQVTQVIIRLISSVPDLDKNPFEHPNQRRRRRTPKIHT